MKNTLLFDFSVDRENKTIRVKREFNANLQNVWDAWTKAELLDQWWAPKPYKARTKTLNFREGGTWLYAMVSPENVAQWCKADYKKISPLKQFSWRDAFCDENGNVAEEFPNMFWTNTFIDNKGTTTVDIGIQMDTFEHLEKILEMGFREGFTMGMDNLDELLEARQ